MQVEEVVAIGLHDLRKLVDTRQSSFRSAFLNMFERAFLTDTDYLVNALGELDSPHFLVPPPGHYEAKLQPYFKGREYMGSWGPTLGVALVSPADR